MKLFATTSSVILLGLLLTSCADMQQVAASDASFDSVYVVPGMQQDDLYDGIKVWIAENFKSAKAVIELDDKANGTIIGNGTIGGICNIPCLGDNTHSASFTMKVDVKDGRFRLGFSNIEDWAGTGYERLPIQGAMDQIKPKLLAFGDEITASLHEQKRQSNW